jgi:hypothetical protein
MVCGVFVNEDKPTFTELMDAHYTERLGDDYVPMAPEGGWLRE